MAQLAADKAKSALLDRFREREERYRRDQSTAAQEEEGSLPDASDAGKQPKE
jgi:hypothetical protein